MVQSKDMDNWLPGQLLMMEDTGELIVPPGVVPYEINVLKTECTGTVDVGVQTDKLKGLEAGGVCKACTKQLMKEARVVVIPPENENQEMTETAVSDTSLAETLQEIQCDLMTITSKMSLFDDHLTWWNRKIVDVVKENKVVLFLLAEFSLVLVAIYLNAESNVEQVPQKEEETCWMGCMVQYLHENIRANIKGSKN